MCFNSLNSISHRSVNKMQPRERPNESVCYCLLSDALATIYTHAEVSEKAPAHPDPRKMPTDYSNRETLFWGGRNFQQLSEQLKKILIKAKQKGAAIK